MKAYSLIFLLLVGCSTVGTPPPMDSKTVTADVPMAVKCKITPPEIPIFPSDSLKKELDIFDQVKLILADLEARRGYEKRLQAAIGACQ